MNGFVEIAAACYRGWRAGAGAHDGFRQQQAGLAFLFA